MAVSDMTPDGFTEEMRTFASLTAPARITAQGMWGGEYALWLQIDGGQKTMIAHGMPTAVIQEADVYLGNLSIQMRKNLAELIAARAAAGLAA